jgi:hypothetical protein
MSLQTIAAKLRAERLKVAEEIGSKAATVATVATVAVAAAQTLKMPFGDAEAPRAMGNPDGEQLKQTTLAFQGSQFAEQAAAFGWDDISLYGVHKDGAPKERIDAWGLIPLLAWTELGLTLTGIEGDAAMVTSSNGSLLRHIRMRANRGEAIAWQTHPAFVKEGGA